MKEKSYSLNGEDFHDIEYVNDFLEDDMESVFVGDTIKVTHKRFTDCLDVIDMLSNEVYENFSEYSDVYISELEEKGKNHSKNINKLIEEYLNKNVNQPTFYNIEDIKEISVNEFLNMYHNKNETEAK